MINTTVFSWENWCGNAFNETLFRRQRIRESAERAKTPFVVRSPYTNVNFMLPMCAKIAYRIANDRRALAELCEFFQRYADEGQEIILKHEN